MMPKLTSLGLVAILLMAPARLPMAADEPTTADTAAVRKEFTTAMKRVRSRTAEPADSAALKSFVIYDYLVAARLQRDLDRSPSADLDSAIDAFVQAHIGLPVTRNLRNAWLTSLATRQRWDWFLPRANEVATPALICSRLKGRLETGDTKGLGAEALSRWNQPQKQPPDCSPVFAWLRQQGLLTPALAEARTRAALAAGNARLGREFADDVPAVRAAPLLQWAALLESPKVTLTGLAAAPGIPVEPTALEAGFTKLSRTDSSSALELLPQLLARPDLTATLKARLQRAAALGVAYDRNPAALAAFSRLPAEAIDNDVHEWRVRAALWAGDYSKVLTWIEQMPASLASQPRWRYWKARATAATAGNAAATPLFTELAALRDYYGYLASDRVSRSYSLNARPSTDNPATQATLAGTPGLIRAQALFDCDMTDEAGVEWAVALNNSDAALKIQAAHLAAQWGWYAQAITTLAQAGEWDDVRLRYPRPYLPAVTQASQLTQLPQDWIYAVMRQESLYRKDAVSRADARGLMQMLPSTAKAVARRWHVAAPTPNDPFDPNRDVPLGAAYLSELLERYNGQIGPSLAAYNAGPAAVARWLPNQATDADVWVENIPYGETRAYVQRILEHIVAFAYVRDAEPPRLTAMLPQITPNTPASTAPREAAQPTPPAGSAQPAGSGRSFSRR